MNTLLPNKDSKNSIWSLEKFEIIFLLTVYAIGVAFRLLPRLSLDPHLLTFQADIWYRLCLAQFLLDHGHLPLWDIRYEAYGYVPLWYNPLSIYFFALLSKLSQLDLPTVCSRIMPFVEAISIIPFYFLCRALYQKRIALIATLFLLLSPSYLYWTGISTLQSFTIFLIPLILLLWIRFVQREFLFSNRLRHLIIMSALLAINFLTHLSYFTLLIILVCVQIGLILGRRSKIADSFYLIAIIILSQLMTINWWLPTNLYWWWTQGLTTSSGFAEGLKYFKEYGITSGLLGHASLIIVLFLAARSEKNLSSLSLYLIPLFWALFPFLESHNEGFLKILGHPEWAWNNFLKPLEGFRFYVFLTQPLALCAGIVLSHGAHFLARQKIILQKSLWIILVAILCCALTYDILFLYKLSSRLRNSGMKISCIKAAQWFRANSKPTDRILAEYYTAQMFSGICGGKALLGSMFPLKNVPGVFKKDKWAVQKDIYSVYTSQDIKQVEKILRRYGCTHVYVSKKLLEHVVFLTKQDSVIPDVEKINEEDLSQTLYNQNYFEIVYEDNDIKILKLIDPLSEKK